MDLLSDLLEKYFLSEITNIVNESIQEMKPEVQSQLHGARIAELKEKLGAEFVNEMLEN